MSQPRPRPARASTMLRIVVGIVISAGALYLALRHVDYTEIANAVRLVNPWLIVLALITIGITTVAKVFRWSVLLEPAGHTLPLRTGLAALLVGQMLNTLIPARVGDLSRAYMVGRTGPGQVFTLGTVVLEKLIDTLAYGLLCLLLVLVMPLPTWLARTVHGIVALGAVSVMLLILASSRQQWFRRLLAWSLSKLRYRPSQRWRERFAQAGLSMQALHNRSRLLRIAGWSLVIWLTAVLTNTLMLEALHLQLPPVTGLLLLVVLQAAITVPSVPGTIGVYEYLCVLALALFNVAPGAAFSYGVLLHAVVLVPSTLIGLICFWTMGRPTGQAHTGKVASK